MSPPASWSLEPVVLLLGALALGLYAWRWWAVRASPGRILAFTSGVLVGVLALVSPVDTLGEHLFLMHMAQHVLLLDLGIILVLLGLTKVILRPVTRRVQRLERAAGPLAHPVFAIVLYVAVMWVWHVPALYDAAVRNPFLHVLEHTSFATAGLLYWWHLLSPIRGRHRLGGMGPVAYMVATKVLVGLLGVALTFAPEAVYQVYIDQPEWWGLSATTDQAVGGLIMALEQSVVMGVALVYLLVRALEESEREDQRAERYGSV
ncbi:MAG: cytochrome c oxidase assembly protein [Actinomycetota bacterium]|nr:cytochrome c oxidase assembly protein [Actinomycetota bacterium]